MTLVLPVPFPRPVPRPFTVSSLRGFTARPPAVGIGDPAGVTVAVNWTFGRFKPVSPSQDRVCAAEAGTMSKTSPNGIPNSNATLLRNKALAIFMSPAAPLPRFTRVSLVEAVGRLHSAGWHSSQILCASGVYTLIVLVKPVSQPRGAKCCVLRWNEGNHISLPDNLGICPGDITGCKLQLG